MVKNATSYKKVYLISWGSVIIEDCTLQIFPLIFFISQYFIYFPGNLNHHEPKSKMAPYRSNNYKNGINNPNTLNKEELLEK